LGGHLQLSYKPLHCAPESILGLSQFAVEKAYFEAHSQASNFSSHFLPLSTLVPVQFVLSYANTLGLHWQDLKYAPLDGQKYLGDLFSGHDFKVYPLSGQVFGLDGSFAPEPAVLPLSPKNLIAALTFAGARLKAVKKAVIKIILDRFLIFVSPRAK
jgi:hypothetical protein